MEYTTRDPLPQMHHPHHSLYKNPSRIPSELPLGLPRTSALAYRRRETLPPPIDPPAFPSKVKPITFSVRLTSTTSSPLAIFARHSPHPLCPPLFDYCICLCDLHSPRHRCLRYDPQCFAYWAFLPAQLRLRLPSHVPWVSHPFYRSLVVCLLARSAPPSSRLPLQRRFEGHEHAVPLVLWHRVLLSRDLRCVIAYGQGGPALPCSGRV